MEQTPSTRDVVNGVMDSLTHFKNSHMKRLEALENNLTSAKKLAIGSAFSTGGSSLVTREQAEHKSRFEAWIRRPYDHSTRSQLAEAQSDLERKAVTIGTDSAGGFAVPELIYSEIERRVTTLNPFRSLVKVVQVGSSDFAHLLDKRGETSAWVGEGGARSETNTPVLAARKPTFGTAYAYPKASEEALQDIFFDVQSWLVDSVAETIASAEATAIISGDGTNKPTGFLTTAPSATPDDGSPARADGALQYLATGSAAGFPALSLTSPVAYPADTIVDLVHSVKSQYLADPTGVAFVMARSTAAVVRKFKDADGNYLWSNALAAGMPATLAGYPVVLTDAMPSIGANTYAIAFGNWRRAYVLADRSSMRVTVDDGITTPGQVKFYVRKRVGGIVLNNEAVKLIKCAVS
jgi:HK97 family phage major capsid protein